MLLLLRQLSVMRRLNTSVSVTVDVNLSARGVTAQLTVSTSLMKAANAVSVACLLLIMISVSK